MKNLIILLVIPFVLLAKPGYHEPWGKDADIAKKKEKIAEKKPSIFTWSADKIIRFHHSFLSPISGPRSHFRPTSSRYMQLAMKRYGFLQGLLMGLDRLMRENNEKWVYQKVTVDGFEYKYDPAVVNKKEKIKR